MNLGAGLGIAVREFPTGSGPVDYALFVGRDLCGVIEAKPAGTTLSGYAEQAARYIPTFLNIWCGARAKSGMNMLPRTTKPCSATMPIRPHVPGASSHFIAPRPCNERLPKKPTSAAGFDQCRR
jgi:hypothetical protein